MGADAFYTPAVRVLVETMFGMAEAGTPIDLVTVLEALTRTGTLERIGGGGVLDKACDTAVTPTSAQHYLETVRECWILREIILQAQGLALEAQSAESGTKLLAGAADRFFGIVKAMVREESNASVMEGLLAGWAESFASGVPAVQMRTPWEGLTKLMTGIEPGLTLIGGRPSAGKTTLEDCLSVHLAQQGFPVYRLTRDTTRKQLLARALSREAGVSLPKMKFGYCDKGDQKKVAGAIEALRDLPIYIEDKLGDISQVVTWARMMTARHGPGVLTIDYVQLLTAERLKRGYDDANARMTYIANKLKDLAVEMELPIIALSQLSREVEKENRTPKLSDLRDSGTIEQAADKVLFVYVDVKKRDAMDDPKKGGTRGTTKHKRPVWVEVMKQKDGATGGMPMWLHAPYFKFEPAQVGDDGSAFSDDRLPGDRGDREQRENEWGARPKFMPADEGERRPEQHGGRGDEEMEMKLGDGGSGGNGEEGEE
jgi:replicative DNA helicase